MTMFSAKSRCPSPHRHWTHREQLRHRSSRGTAEEDPETTLLQYAALCKQQQFTYLNEHSLRFTLTNHKTVGQVVTEIVSQLLLLHPFNGLFSRTTWVSRHQKGKPFWILWEQDTGWQWHQLDHMQIICTSHQTYNHTSTAQNSTKVARNSHVVFPLKAVGGKVT